mmetsp:Transcript_10590/g.14274  ORF Transcript_10590/g.14274 Transcript_10590/m.14274 type:complete len:202 (+) Transcript_10590:153-758(+)
MRLKARRLSRKSRLRRVLRRMTSPWKRRAKMRRLRRANKSLPKRSNLPLVRFPLVEEQPKQQPCLQRKPKRPRLPKKRKEFSREEDEVGLLALLKIAMRNRRATKIKVLKRGSLISSLKNLMKTVAPLTLKEKQASQSKKISNGTSTATSARTVATSCAARAAHRLLITSASAFVRHPRATGGARIALPRKLRTSSNKRKH